jgi:arginase
MAQAPLALRGAGLEARLNRLGVQALWQVVSIPDPMRPRLEQIVDVCREAAVNVEKAVREGRPFLALGGDHSVAAGTWAGVANALEQPFGLLWIDAHMDAHTPATTPSGDLHGMPLACLLGHGEPALVRLTRHGPALRGEHVCLIGSNSYEPEEEALLRRSGARIFTAQEVHRRGFVTVLDEALAHVRTAPGGFGVSLDIDVIDVRDAPGVVMSKVHNPQWPGLRADQVQEGLHGLAQVPGFLGLEAVELNPDNDVMHEGTGKTVALMLGLIEEVLTERR